jgi:probable HAF family extracellular repeat protein
MTDLGTLYGGNGGAYGVNNSGEVVGYSDLEGEGRAFLHKDGQMTDLNDPIPSDSGWTLGSAFAINDEGQIVAYGWNTDGRHNAVLLEVDVDPPTVASVNPTDLKKKVPRRTNIMATFSEEMNADTLTESTVHLITPGPEERWQLR